MKYAFLFAAMLSMLALLSAAPGVTVGLVSPADGYSTSSASIAFSFIYDRGSPVNPAVTACSIYLDSVSKGSVPDAASGENSTIMLNGISGGLHTWSVTCEDTSSGSRSFTVTSGGSPSVTLDSPSNGASVYNNANLFLKYTYTANGGPSPVTCNLILDGEDLGPYETNSGEQVPWSAGTPYEGVHTWRVACTDGGSTNVQSPQYSFTVQPPASPPSVALNFPADGYSGTTAPSAFGFKYLAGNTGPKSNVKCELYVDDVVKYTAYSMSDGSSDTTSVSGIGAGSHSWRVMCAGSIASETRSFTVTKTADNGGGTGTGTGTGTGSGSGSTGTGSTSGGGTPATPRNATPPKPPVPMQNTTTPPQANIATLYAPAQAYLNLSVSATLVGNGGTPIRGAAISVLKPNGGIIKLVTDASGTVRYVPNVVGVYSYSVAGYEVRGAAKTTVVEQPAPPQAPGSDWAQLINYGAIFVGIVAVAGAAVALYLHFTKKKEE